MNMIMTDSCWCTAETITTLKTNYPPIKKKTKIKVKSNKHAALCRSQTAVWKRRYNFTWVTKQYLAWQKECPVLSTGFGSILTFMFRRWWCHVLSGRTLHDVMMIDIWKVLFDSQALEKNFQVTDTITSCLSGGKCVSGRMSVSGPK